MGRFNFASLLGGSATVTEPETVEAEETKAPVLASTDTVVVDAEAAEADMEPDPTDENEDDPEDDDEEDNYAFGMFEGIAGERERCVKVLRAIGQDVAAELLATDMNAESVIALVAKLPKGDGGSALDRVMQAQGNPKLGTGVASPDESSFDAKAAWKRHTDKLTRNLKR